MSTQTATKNLVAGQIVRLGDRDHAVTAIQRDVRGIYSVTLTKVNASPFEAQHPYTRRASASAVWFAAGTTITARMA